MRSNGGAPKWLLRQHGSTVPASRTGGLYSNYLRRMPDTPARRDIKPHNFLLLPDSHLLLTDFGSSAPLIPRVQLSSKTIKPVPLFVSRRYCRILAGTPDYVAPEVLLFAEQAVVEAMRPSDVGDDEGQTNGLSEGQSIDERDKGYDASIDWWSLGATLCEMATGRAPFWASSIRETYDNIIRSDPGQLLSEEDALSPDLKDLIQQ